MARRQSAIEDIVDIAAKLPWWVGVLLAVLSYVVLHFMAGTEIDAPKTAHGIGDVFGNQIIRTLAMFGQYILPIAFVAGAGLSAARGWKQSASSIDMASDPGRGAGRYSSSRSSKPAPDSGASGRG